MAAIRIEQIFIDTDLRAGENVLGTEMFKQGYSQGSLPIGHVCVFVNKKRNLVKIVGQRGMLTERLPDKCTFDFSLRRNEIFDAVGRYFGIELTMPGTVYKRVAA